MGSRTKSHVLSNDHQLGFERGRFSGPSEIPKSPRQEAVICPRCGSPKTKFCYYNNYNKSQPRHFCKSCKRHWTKGGTIRNVPAGGGRRKKRRKVPTAAMAEPPQQHCRNIPSNDDSTGLNISTDTADYYYPGYLDYNMGLDIPAHGEMGLSSYWNEIDVLDNSSDGPGVDIAWADIYTEIDPKIN